MFLVPFTKTSACFPCVFHVVTGLITSVPVNDLPFLNDVVFSLGATRSSLTLLEPLK